MGRIFQGKPARDTETAAESMLGFSSVYKESRLSTEQQRPLSISTQLQVMTKVEDIVKSRNALYK